MHSHAHSVRPVLVIGDRSVEWNSK